MISEDTIMKHLDFHLTQADPGDLLHHLTVLRAKNCEVGPFGGFDASKLHTMMYAIAPVGDVAEDLVLGTVVRALADARKEDTTIVFASLGMQMWGLLDGADKELADRLLSSGEPLGKHPDSMEYTVIYGVCADGRRWRGRRHVTGPRAGQTEDVEMLVGRPTPGESHGVLAERALLKLVGILP